MIQTDQIKFVKFESSCCKVTFINESFERLDRFEAAKLLVMLRRLSIPYRDRDEDGNEIPNNWENAK